MRLWLAASLPALHPQSSKAGFSRGCWHGVQWRYRTPETALLQFSVPQDFRFPSRAALYAEHVRHWRASRELQTDFFVGLCADSHAAAYAAAGHAHALQRFPFVSQPSV